MLAVTLPVVVEALEAPLVSPLAAETVAEAEEEAAVVKAAEVAPSRDIRKQERTAATEEAAAVVDRHG